MQRVVREGNEIGNHTYTHPDISEISARQLDLEINLTERLFASKLGVQPLYFRPPYDIDEEPDTDDQAAPVVAHPAGWTHHHRQQDRHQRLERASPQDAAEIIAVRPRPVGNHEDQAAVPRLHHPDARRRRRPLGHRGRAAHADRHAARPRLHHRSRLRADGQDHRPGDAASSPSGSACAPCPTPSPSPALAIIGNFIVMVFFVGDILMSARLILVGIFAVIDRLRRPHRAASPGFNPRVAVLIPAYNEETVIVRTIRSVLNSDYNNLHVIVIDDGSSDRTSEVAAPGLRRRDRRRPRAGAHQAQRRQGRRAQLRPRPHERGDLTSASTPTPSSPPTPSPSSFPTLRIPLIGAIAGNAKVGNRVNLWTRWQALEYITSQNFERRALDLFHVVTVVPGAIGAWRTAPVKAAGGYPAQHRRRRRRPHHEPARAGPQGRSTKTARWPSLRRPSMRRA